MLEEKCRSAVTLQTNGPLVFIQVYARVQGNNYWLPPEKQALGKADCHKASSTCCGGGMPSFSSTRSLMRFTVSVGSMSNSISLPANRHNTIYLIKTQDYLERVGQTQGLRCTVSCHEGHSQTLEYRCRSWGIERYFRALAICNFAVLPGEACAA